MIGAIINFRREIFKRNSNTTIYIQQIKRKKNKLLLINKEIEIKLNLVKIK